MRDALKMVTVLMSSLCCCCRLSWILFAACVGHVALHPALLDCSDLPSDVSIDFSKTCSK